MNKIIAVGLVGLVLFMTGCVPFVQDKIIPEMEKMTDQKLIENIFAERNPDGKLGEMVIEVDRMSGVYASGLITDKEGWGGARWLAYRDQGQWKIIWEGNGDIFCRDIESYGFPVDMVSECWDEKNQVMKDRTGNSETDYDLANEEKILEGVMKDYLTDGELDEFLVDQIDDDYANGSVSLIGGAGGWWLAVKNGEWEIVAVGSDVVDCDLVDEYGFPVDMVTDCYDWEADVSRKR